MALTDSALAQRVLVHDAERHRRPDIQSTRTTRLTRTGLIENDDDLWRDRRNRLQPLFRPNRIAAYAAAIGDETETLYRRWSAGDEGDLLEEMTTLTVRIIKSEENTNAFRRGMNPTIHSTIHHR